jgi:DeoR/GlpR family transcriptional regulator of sugar metabolism
MTHNPRIESILAIISRKRSVSVLELKQRLGVSEVTIRKDLDYLESEGIIIRTHGGATMAEDRRVLRSVSMREGQRQEEKDAIARAAREYIAEGETIFLDAGTTCLAIAREIRGRSLQVVTTSFDVLGELADADGISLFCPGGSMRRESRGFIGPAAIRAMDDIQVQSCFVGASGFSSEGCFATQNAIEAEIKRKALAISKRRIIAADSSKYGVSAFAVFARPGDVDLLITDRGFADSEPLRSLGIEVLLASIDGMA